MIDYVKNITDSKLSIYDNVIGIQHLYIPTDYLQCILHYNLAGLHVDFPLRTRSKFVKEKICAALGYPIPKSFKKTQPRFFGQNFDVYIQKNRNVQIWNEEIEPTRRYVFIQVDENNYITSIKIIDGNQLSIYDKTGTLTQKYQATMHNYEDNICSSNDTNTLISWITKAVNHSVKSAPNLVPKKDQLLEINEIYNRLLPMLGQSLPYIDALQERNRGAMLHSMVCNYLGYNTFEDNGSFPDIPHQLLEVKLQTSPTIDLGLHSPDSNNIIFTSSDAIFTCRDVRYAIFKAERNGNFITLKNLYLVTGEQFYSYFPAFIGQGINSKIQLPLPLDFFD